jgi:hypothetical protein
MEVTLALPDLKPVTVSPQPGSDLFEQHALANPLFTSPTGAAG